MADINSVIPILKATILSTSGLVAIDQCDRDYRELQGELIPYRRLGFKSLEDLFEKVPGFRLIKQNGRLFVDASAPCEVEHITEMISRQKSASSKRQPKRYLQRPPRRLKSDTSWNPGVSSNMWKFSKPHTKVPYTYDKPKARTADVKSAAVSKPIETIEPPQKVVKPCKLSIVKKATKETEIKKTPISTLSGLRPGDMLARSLSTPANGSSSNNIPVSSVIPRPTPETVTVPVRLSAADRMNALQNNLHKSEPLIQLVKFKNDEIDLKDNKSRLLRCCQEMGLPVPIYKTHVIKNKGRLPSLYDCTVKVGTAHSFTTYPDSKGSMDLAIEAAAGQALAHLQKLIIEDSHPFTEPSIAISRIINAVSSHQNGLWAYQLPAIYKDEYKEKLPKDWLNLVDKCSQITKEEGANGLAILLPADPNMVLESSSTCPSMDAGGDQISGPPSLQFPDDPLWNVFIMSAHSTVEVWLRIVGENYSELFASLTTDMEHYFMGMSKSSENIAEGGWYALNCEDCWVRARVLELDNQKRRALCFFVDSGDEEEHPYNSFFDLPQQFLNLPPQAILCRLAGLEEYASVGQISGQNLHLLEMVTGKVLVAEVLQTPEESLSLDDPTITVVLFDTSTDVDVNINKEILIRMSQQARSPTLISEFSKVYVTDITATGKVCVQIHDENWKLLQQMMQPIQSGTFPKEALQASFGPLSPTPSVLYLVKSCTGEWRRAVLRSGITYDNQGVSFVSVRYIDYGGTERIPVRDVLLLKRISEALNEFPAQALYLTLYNVGNVSQEMIRKVNDLIPTNSPVLCKQVDPGSNVVELYVRTQPLNLLCSINNALKMERDFANMNISDSPTPDPLEALNKKKERIFSPKNVVPATTSIRRGSESPTDGVPQFTIPEKGSLFNVQVSMSASPWNFVVQPFNLLPELTKMMTELQEVCKKLPADKIVPIIGGIYAALHTKEQSWYRVRLQGIVSLNMASIYFIDFGDHSMVNVEDLRELPSSFKKLPGLAIKAKLHGVSPTNLDWSVEDCLRFQTLVENQSFVSVIENIELDPLHKGEVLLLLNLVDTSTPEDLYLNVLLAKEGRAIFTK